MNGKGYFGNNNYNYDDVYSRGMLNPLMLGMMSYPYMNYPYYQPYPSYAPAAYPGYAPGKVFFTKFADIFAVFKRIKFKLVYIIKP